MRGHVFVCVLSYLLGRTLELQLENAGHPLSVERATEALEPVRVVRNELGGRVMHCVLRSSLPGVASCPYQEPHLHAESHEVGAGSSV